MRTPGELENYFMSSNRGKGNSLSFKDFIAEIQKHSYNQAIEDAISAEWRQHNGIEFTDEEMRAKLKIK